MPHLGVPNDFHGRGYDPNQPRVPAGHPDGGQWTKVGHEAGPTSQGSIVDALPIDDLYQEGQRYAARRGPAVVYIGGRPYQLTPGQAARLTVAEAEASAAIGRVRAHDPHWRPPASLYSTPEGLISSHRADAQAARDRWAELQYNGIVPGPYFREGIPARGPSRNFNAQEHRSGDELMSRHGCHTCGTRISGTLSGSAVLDHQPPTNYNPWGKRQLLLPQCLNCMRRQGGWVRQHGGMRR